ncbi:S-adenosyl-L-methionine-dependent methyltransferase [Lineolata rhizophorae]|uniref:S-adenosyl-L-methionine-dependent methyltransferase n=1 Tax=Lineolata rhizophorae TaxID=578093 RepID=A0A6A6P901_9PEZI|nr:S-adenosyl-L-methionine-dependent methyltransferase [Lineolata rhizophorae]
MRNPPFYSKFKKMFRQECFCPWVSSFISTFVKTAVTEPKALFNLRSLRERSFGILWMKNGAAISEEMPGNIDKLLAEARGVVLDLGPGTGEQMHRFTADNIKAMYGAEPGLSMHPSILRRAKETGLAEKYHLLGCGAEKESLIPALAKDGILGEGASEGIFDEIMCVRVLCAVPRHEETIQNLYKLLKPGGRMVVCEHVRNSCCMGGSFLGGAFQSLYAMLAWNFFLCCHLRRDTAKVLKEAGGKNGWAKINLQLIGEHGPVPFIVGDMIKAA